MERWEGGWGCCGMMGGGWDCFGVTGAGGWSWLLFCTSLLNKVTICSCCCTICINCMCTSEMLHDCNQPHTTNQGFATQHKIEKISTLGSLCSYCTWGVLFLVINVNIVVALTNCTCIWKLITVYCCKGSVKLTGRL